MKRRGISEVPCSYLPYANKKRKEFGRCVAFLRFIAGICFLKHEDYGVC